MQANPLILSCVQGMGYCAVRESEACLGILLGTSTSVCPLQQGNAALMPPLQCLDLDNATGWVIIVAGLLGQLGHLSNFWTRYRRKQPWVGTFLFCGRKCFDYYCTYCPAHHRKHQSSLALTDGLRVETRILEIVPRSYPCCCKKTSCSWVWMLLQTR